MGPADYLGCYSNEPISESSGVARQISQATVIIDGNKTFLVMSSLGKELKERAECLFQQKQLGNKAVHDYRAKEEATRQLTFKLRAERLAREAVPAKPATFA
jgi:hypothetical protein